MKIKKIKRLIVNDTPMYDVINVPKNHNFIIGDNNHNINFISHNCAIDEMSFGDNDNVDYQQAGMMAIYNQLYLRLSSRFSRGGRIQGRMYLISSAKSTNAVLESFIRDNEDQPGMHVSRYKQWEVLPASKFSGEWFKIAVGNELLASYIMGVNVPQEQIQEAEMKGYTVIDVPLEMYHRFEMDFNRTLIDSCGISVQSAYKYIPYKIVEPCIGNGTNPFNTEIIKTGLNDKYEIADFFLPELVPEILYTKKLYVHCDLSKSGDMTGISAVAVLGYKNQERFADDGSSSNMKEMVFRQVFSVGIQCPPNDELSMIKVKDFIHYLKYTLGWNIAGVSCDGYQSLMLLQSLQLDGFVTKEVSMDILKNKECIGYTTFRNVLVEQRIKLLKLKELIKEITNLEKNETTGKIDHPKQCLVGTTKIRMLDGTSKTIGDLIIDKQNNINNYVYTFNEKTKQIEPKLIKNVWFTGYRKDLYKIYLDNDEYIICTSNHPFMMRDGSYIEAENLQIGQSLMPLYTKVSKKGLRGYRLYYEPIEQKWHYEHRKFFKAETKHKDYVVHHCNYNKLDNRPSNLKYMSRKKHTIIHNRTHSIEEQNKRSNSVKNWHLEHKNTQEYINRNKKCSEKMKEYNRKHPEIIEKRGERTRNIYKNLSKEIKQKMTRQNQNSYTDMQTGKMYFLNKNEKIPNNLVLGRYENKELFFELVATIPKEQIRKEYKKRMYKIQLDKAKLKYSMQKEYKNHKIIQIEKLNKYEKVYDLEIEDNHNFALDSGIFVHNSVKILDDGTKVKSVGKDISDSLGGAIFNATQSVDINELDYLENVTIADSNVTLGTHNNVADNIFGIKSNYDGTISVHTQQEQQMSLDDQISNAIINDISVSQTILKKIKENNPNTNLSDNQIKDLYDEFSGDGFVIF